MGRKMDNTAQTIDQPANVTYNPPNYTGVAVVAVAFVLLSCPFAWWTGTFLFDRAGYYEPDKALASFVLVFIGAVAGLALVSVLGYVIGRFVLSLVLAGARDYYEHTERLAQWTAEARRYEQMTAQRALPTGRMNSDNVRWAKLVQAVMSDAYDHLAKVGPYRYNEGYPWSRETAKEIVLANETEPVGYEMGNRVRDWLRQYDVIVLSGKIWQVNVKRYPDMGAIDSLLYRLYDVPVVVNGATSALPAYDNSGYQFIEK